MLGDMHEIALALLWHQHQPYYPDDVGQENPMPWVRLHGTRDYWGMAALLEEVPEMRATINLVPSLLAQLAAYTEGGHEDAHLRISRLPADGLSEDDLVYMVENFFMVHPDQMIRPYPRYLELWQKRGQAGEPPLRVARRFSKRDLIDLACWANLVWIHPLAFERDADLAEFRRKGRHWSEQEKAWLLQRQRELLREIVPLHRKLAEQGQIELSTTPFYHPILPLLIDKRLARQAMPDVSLPRHLEGYPEDAARQIRQAVEYHQRVFGRPPRGLWPSEGSVCQAIIPPCADAGLEWLATDEEILSCSTDGLVSRDGQGYLRHPELLYRPWRVEETGRAMQVIFRDHAMSDQIGFHYQRYHADHAVDDFVGKLEGIGRATHAHAGHRPTLVSIILDGENCWDYYANAGVDFLRALYRRVAQHPKISPARVSDYLDQYPATDKLQHLFPGSWIQHNFGIWIGHPECNRAWDLLHAAREHLARAQRSGHVPPAQLDQAWRELSIAEGSDWFWWFGDSHSSAQDAVFDRLFRKHLQNVYLVLGDVPPAELARPISQAHRYPGLHTQPTSLLRVKVDGHRTYFEWLNAGRYVCQTARGTMSMAQEGRLAELCFGFDTQRLLLRLDARGGSVRELLADMDLLRVVFLQPAGFELTVARPSWHAPVAQLLHHDVVVGQAGVAAAADQILELAVPLRSLGLATDDLVQFFVELCQQGQAVERLPLEGRIETSVPSPDFEQIMWQA